MLRMIDWYNASRLIIFGRFISKCINGNSFILFLQFTHVIRSSWKINIIEIVPLNELCIICFSTFMILIRNIFRMKACHYCILETFLPFTSDIKYTCFAANSPGTMKLDAPPLSNLYLTRESLTLFMAATTQLLPRLVNLSIYFSSLSCIWSIKSSMSLAHWIGVAFVLK